MTASETPPADLDDLWHRATRHRFLDGVREGTLSAAAFDRWLAQDGIFAADLLTFQARLLARAPRDTQGPLAAGCVALVDELAWFTRKAAERGVATAVDPLPATLAYRELLARLDGTDAGPAATALWAIEKVYLLAWRGAASPDSPYAEFVDRWSSDGFAAYVDALAAAADPDRDADLVAEVLVAEIAFWDSAVE